MRKISLVLLACFLSILQLVGQTTDDSKIQYKKKKLSLDEVSVLSSFYTQDGNNSAVTGGIGTEKLTDFSNQLDVKLLINNKKGNHHKIDAGFGIDYYTSASSDNIEPQVNITSASYSDERFYPSLNYQYEDVTKNFNIGTGLYYSTEFDYNSIGVNALFSKTFNQKNTTVGFNTNLYFDELKVIRPFELRSGTTGLYNYDNANRNTYAFNLIFSQVLSKVMQMAITVNPVFQNGFLSTSFNRVYNTTGASMFEVLPSNRFKFPVGFRLNYMINRKFALRSFYRFYIDDWGILSNMLEEEISLPISKKATFLPYFRVYQQTASKYFGPYETFTGSEDYRTSDYDLSQFVSFMPGLTFRLADSEKLFFKPLSSLELKYSYYHRSNNLNAHILSLRISFR